MQASMRRGVEMLEQMLEVPDGPAVGSRARVLGERALDLFRSSAFVRTQGVVFAAVRGAGAGSGGGRARGRGRGARGRGEGARGGGARGGRGRGGVRGRGRARGGRGRGE